MNSSTPKARGIRSEAPYYESKVQAVDLSGKYPVISWWNGSETIRTKITKVNLASGYRQRGATLLYSKIWFRDCSVCEKPFTARLYWENSCSDECAAFLLRLNTRIKKGLQLIRACRVCGETFEIKRSVPGQGSVGKYCSQECRKLFKRVRESITGAMQRALDKGFRFDLIDPIIVFKLQRWRCQWCSKICDQSKRGTNHRDAPELDHIQPMAKGGTHTWENVQTLCRKCNSEKRDKFA